MTGGQISPNGFAVLLDVLFDQSLLDSLQSLLVEIPHNLLTVLLPICPVTYQVIDHIVAVSIEYY